MTVASTTYAVLTEGEAEYASLGRLYPKIHRGTEVRLLAPVKVSTTPDAPPRRVAHACIPALKLSAARGAAVAVLLVDREQADDAAESIASRIQEELVKLGILPTRVVLKDRMFENWLVADIDSVASLTSRFSITGAMRSRVVPDKADTCDALALLKTAAIKRPYHKVQDAKRICPVMRVERAAANSRSFRRFLQTLGHGSYASQGVRPAEPQRARTRGRGSGEPQ